MIFFYKQCDVLNLSCMLESLNGANSKERDSSVVARFKNYCIYLYVVDFENLDFLCRFSSVGRATDL